MRRTVPSLVLAVLLCGHPAPGQEPAPPADPARALLDRAIEAQGGWTADTLEDVHLVFRGQIAEDGRTNSVHREYWYRARDRAFRLLTAPLAATRHETEHGVLGRRYWDRTRGRLQDLSLGNREHEGQIRSIRGDREEFERIVSMLLLSRLHEEDTAVAFGAPEPVSLRGDRPPEVGSILRDRAARTYHVLDVRRPGEPKLRAYLDSGDLTVRKVEQFHPDDDERLEFVYYFGPYRKDAATGLLLPQFFSVHDAVPVDERTRDASLRAKGTLTIELNRGLGDEALAPTADG